MRGGAQTGVRTLAVARDEPGAAGALRLGTLSGIWRLQTGVRSSEREVDEQEELVLELRGEHSYFYVAAPLHSTSTSAR